MAIIIPIKAKSLWIFKGTFITLEPVRTASSTQIYVIMPRGFINPLIIMHPLFAFTHPNEYGHYSTE